MFGVASRMSENICVYITDSAYNGRKVLKIAGAVKMYVAEIDRPIKNKINDLKAIVLLISSKDLWLILGSIIDWMSLGRFFICLGIAEAIANIASCVAPRN